MNILKKSQLQWASRRGMLELDLLLKPFVDEVFETLKCEEQATFQALLSHADPQLFAWLMRKEVPNNPDFEVLIRKIITHARSRFSV